MKFQINVLILYNNHRNVCDNNKFPDIIIVSYRFWKYRQIDPFVLTSTKITQGSRIHI